MAEPRGRAFFQEKASWDLLFYKLPFAGGEEEGMTRNDILHNLESDLNDNNGDWCFGVIRGTCLK